MPCKNWLSRLTCCLTLSLCLGCSPIHTLSFIAVSVPVPPWVADRLDEKFSSRLQHRTPIMPPILPGTPPPRCEDPPQDEEIIRALPKVIRGIPYILEEFRDIQDIRKELIVDQIDPCRFYPLVGPAQLHHCHYKCTVYYKQIIQSSYPFPFKIVEDRVEVVYIDKDHLHVCVGPEEAMQRQVQQELFGASLR
ncbi:MAG: hypothetical protein RMI91_06505 [Gemmatales bacterium]|nr:hypothetical protein [Gemmatales bacterium]MDW7994287.1 hypothetical protein [Gemmatales bacterium]